MFQNENEENRRILLDVEIIDRIVSAFYLIVQVSFTSALGWFEEFFCYCSSFIVRLQHRLGFFFILFDSGN